LTWLNDWGHFILREYQNIQMRIFIISLLLSIVYGFDPQRTFTADLTKAFNIFLLDQFDQDIIDTEVKDVYHFGSRSIEALQEFLAAKGRLAYSQKYFNSLTIGTLQNYLYDQGIYPDYKPCGIFGTNTRKSLKKFLQKQSFYRYSPYHVSASNPNFDTKSVKLLQEFFSRETDPSGIPYYRSRIDGRWKTETIQALAKYLHDQNARVAYDSQCSTGLIKVTARSSGNCFFIPSVKSTSSGSSS